MKTSIYDPVIARSRVNKLTKFIKFNIIKGQFCSKDPKASHKVAYHDKNDKYEEKSLNDF